MLKREPLSGLTLQSFIINVIEDAKGSDITPIDVKGKSSITDAMIICSGTSSRHVSSIADHLLQAAKKQEISLLNISGEKDSDWIVVDFDEVIVHIMLPETRNLYQLEKLWGEL